MSLKLMGTDRFGHIGDLSSFGDGTVVLDVPLVPSSLPRLRNLAGSYQRIVWRRLTFRFEPLVPTSVTGGYVCGFLPDADDSITEAAAPLDRLMAHPGSKLVKAWQSAVITHKCVGDRLYTSRPPRGEARLYSPGRVALVIDSKISGGSGVLAPLSVYLDWEVELMEPSLEATSTKANTVEAMASFYLRSGHLGLWYSDNTGGDDPRSKIPGIQWDVVYRLGSKRYCLWTDTAQGTSITLAGNWDRICLKQDSSAGTTFWILDYKGEPIRKYGYVNQFMIEKGDILVPESGNALVGLEFLQQTPSWRDFGSKLERSSKPSEDSDRWEIVSRD